MNFLSKLMQLFFLQNKFYISVFGYESIFIKTYQISIKLLENQKKILTKNKMSTHFAYPCLKVKTLDIGHNKVLKANGALSYLNYYNVLNFGISFAK